MRRLYERHNILLNILSDRNYYFTYYLGRYNDISKALIGSNRNICMSKVYVKMKFL